jgi:putative phosphoesterase
MKIGVISDLHSNIHALDAVLPLLDDLRIDHLIVLGDFFGYYPWALQTWQRLRHSPWPMTLIKGNHDEMLLRHQADPTQVTTAAYTSVISQNLQDLAHSDALETLSRLSFSHTLHLRQQTLRLVHGTPTDPENGRFYPTDSVPMDWDTASIDWLLLGHTHYPIIRELQPGVSLLNPGSVGQPRDGDPRASFATLNLDDHRPVFHRAAYDVQAAQEELRDLGWSERSIRALDKRHSGSLDHPHST